MPAFFPSALTIAGSDSGGGAGIQADLKTFAALGVHGLSAIAALTAQHTRGVTAVHLPPLEFLQAQLDALFDDFEIAAVKIGMLANAEIIHHVADVLEHYRPPRIVLDPVMVATSGAKLLEDNALAALRERLLPLADVLTPNLPEAELLLERRIDTTDGMEDALSALRALGVRSVLLKGGHLDEGYDVIDRFDDGQMRAHFVHRRLQINAHGTGCTLSSAIAAHLCHGLPMIEACRAAADYIARTLHDGYQPGRSGVTVLAHVVAQDGRSDVPGSAG